MTVWNTIVEAFGVLAIAAVGIFTVGWALYAGAIGSEKQAEVGFTRGRKATYEEIARWFGEDDHLRVAMDLLADGDEIGRVRDGWRKARQQISDQAAAFASKWQAARELNGHLAVAIADALEIPYDQYTEIDREHAQRLRREYVERGERIEKLEAAIRALPWGPAFDANGLRLGDRMHFAPELKELRILLDESEVTA